MEFMRRLWLLQYLYDDSDRQVIENAKLNLDCKYLLGLAVIVGPLISFLPSASALG